MIVFPNSAKSTNGTSAVLQVAGISAPEGVAVSQNTGESWLASPGANQIYRFPRFETLLSTLAPDYTIPSPIPLALGLDSKDDLIVGEGINRVSFYYPSMYFKNSASYAAGVNSTSQIAPGMLLNLGRYRSMFALPAMAGFAAPPYQTTLNDIQVTVNGTAAPIYYLLQSIGWVYLQVPSSAPSSGTADFVVQQVSTGQILGASTFSMQAFAPGLFTTNNAGTGQVAANNLDAGGNYLNNNGPNTPLSINNGIIVLYGTGQGFIPGGPPDGQAPGAAFSTPITPTVYIGATPGKVLYSGLSPQYPGLWQIDVQVPAGTIGTGKLPVVVQMGDYTSNVGGTNSTIPGATVGEPGSDIPLTLPNNNITTMATH
jgi:uncharacterized protein (TIGR03437 family)